MLGRNAHHMGIHCWKRTRQGFEMLLIEGRFSLLFRKLHITILSHAHHKVIAQFLTGLPKCVDIAAAVPHVDPLVVLRHPSNRARYCAPTPAILGRASCVAPWFPLRERACG